MYQTTDASKQNSFDAIVIGSGITGGWAAKELTERGLKVLLIERGKNLEHPGYKTASLDPWQLPNAGRLTQQHKKASHVQARHFSFRGDNYHYYINDLENPYEEVKRFDWIRGDIVGGRSILWGRHCYRWGDLDFEANARDGIAIDWPIRYKDVEPYYNYVEKFIGVSGQPEGLTHFPDGHYQPAMEMNCAERFFKKGVETKFPDRRVTIGRVANLTAPVKGRGVCQFRDLCHRGCPYGAYFSTNASTLPAAFATGRLTLKSNTLVNKLIYNESKGIVDRVEVVDTESNAVTEYHAKLIFLNASTVATTFLLLNSTSSRFPNGLGNDSDMVGRNLMDHHKQAGAYGEVDGFEDDYYFGKRANGLYIPRFRNLKEKRADYIRGFGVMGGATRAGWQTHLSKNEIGTELKTAVQQPGQWGLNLGGYGECLPYADNRVTLNTSVKDKYGRNTVTIDCTFRDNEMAMQKDMSASSAEMLDAAGFKNIRPYINTSFPGNANHEMGTARMGKSRKNSVVNSFNQMHEVKNVFITDGSCMTSSSNVNPSLTYMALTVRACEYAVDQMKRRNIPNS